jgi:CRP/FNR family transcriptional regulator, anaerobic regulatory protein
MNSMKMIRKESQLSLERFEPFKRLSNGGKKILSQGLVMASPSRLTSVLQKGQPVSGAYLVMEGRLRVFSIAPNGNEATLYFVDPGEACVLALNCLFNDLLYPAWVQAETHCTVAVVPGAVYRRLFDTEPVIRDLTVRALSTLVFRLMTELEQVHASNHRERLVQFILSHADSDGILRKTQEQVAHHLGTTREVIARLVKDLVNDGLIRTQRGSMLIRDLFGLRSVITPKANAAKNDRRVSKASKGERTFGSAQKSARAT